MAKHADLSIDFLGFKCENPFSCLLHPSAAATICVQGLWKPEERGLFINR